MTEYRHNLPPRPAQMVSLPLDARGYPVPWFVSETAPDGEPEFRVITQGRWNQAIRDDVCWVCGRPLGDVRTFVIGPMCAVNCVTSEPPVHPGCARYSAEACPFLTRPSAMRRDAGLEADVADGGHVAGIMLKRNPGLTILWPALRSSYHLILAGNGALIRLRRPYRIPVAYTKGRLATKEELLAALVTGVPTLVDLAKQEGRASLVDLRMMWTQAIAVLHLPVTQLPEGT